MPRTPDQIVNSEVHYCVSYLVSTLANGCHAVTSDGAVLRDMAEQAAELACPVLDWHEALEQNGWRRATDAERALGFLTWQQEDGEQSDEMAETIANEHGPDPYERDVFEHWIVSDWLANQLETRGEKVDRDFAGMIVWARTTSGQGIASDSVIRAIAADVNRAA